MLEVVVRNRDARAPPPRRVGMHHDLGQLAKEAPRATCGDCAIEELPDALGGDGRGVEGEEQDADCACVGSKLGQQNERDARPSRATQASERGAGRRRGRRWRRQ